MPCLTREEKAFIKGLYYYGYFNKQIKFLLILFYNYYNYYYYKRLRARAYVFLDSDTKKRVAFVSIDGKRYYYCNIRSNKYNNHNLIQ